MLQIHRELLRNGNLRLCEDINVYQMVVRQRRVSHKRKKSVYSLCY